ncbi:MAG: hypothetical protein JWN70_2266 [Planctomycetaceae bacterium]|nr:hypothetical protein [Planctomycetaceae bacterium]
MADPIDNFDINGTLEEYRKAYLAGAKGVCEVFRKAWAALKGVDNLHETAFGKP